MNITILGAGTWGIALAEVLDYNGCKVSIWHYDNEYIANLQKSRFNKKLNSKVSRKINFISSEDEINKSSIILICLPSQSIRNVLVSLKLKNKYYINASKGIELESGKLISQIIDETTLGTHNTIACISGPSHAEELIKKIPTVISVASENSEFSKSIQNLL